MFKRILVPTDFSEKSKHAFDIALNIARMGEGKVVLLHVIEMIADSTFEEFESFYTRLEHKAESSMNAWIKAHPSGADFVEKEIIYGNRALEIVKFSEDHEMDLIVLNSHKINVEDPGGGWGTISYKVSILADCPVMLVK
ncbi:MAG: universal stress protein [Desulfobacterales bacterium]